MINDASGLSETPVDSLLFEAQLNDDTQLITAREVEHPIPSLCQSKRKRGVPRNEEPPFYRQVIDL